jgi:stage V sporulation protein B
MVLRKVTVNTQTPSGARVAKGASYLFIQGLIANACSLLFLIIAARILPVSNIGAISAFGIIASLFMTMGTFAVPSGATKYISEYLGKGEQRTAKDVFEKCLRFGLLTTIIISFLCLALSGVISTLALSDPSLEPIIRVLALDIGALIFNAVLSGILFGLQKFHVIALVGIATSTLKLLASIYFLDVGLKLLGVVIGWVIADLVSAIILLLLTSRSFRKVSNSNELPFGEILRYSLPLYGSSIIAYFSSTIDRFVVLSLSNLTVLGIYSIAMAAVNAIGIVSSSIGNSLFPQMAQLQGLHGRDALKEASVKASRYVFLIFMPLAIGLLATAYPTIELFFGESYTSGSLPMIIVSIVVALTSASVIIGNLLLSLGMTRTILEASVISVAIGAAVSALLVSPLGSIGAAIGRAALLSASFAYSAYTLRTAFGLYLDISAFKKSLICSGIMAIGVIIAQLLLSGKYMLPIYIAIGVIIYVLTLRISKALTYQDVQLLNEILPSRFHRLTDLFVKFFSTED